MRAGDAHERLAGTPSGDSDAKLVERTLAGDTAAFELLAIKYQRQVQRLIGRMVRDVDLVPDIVQETFIRAYRSLRQFRGEAQFYTWLYRIAINAAKRALLRKTRDPLDLPGEAMSPEPASETFSGRREPTTDETPESLLAAKEIAQAVNDALAALPEDLRQALTLREIDGLSYEEIAGVMQCPLGTVRSRIFRAREAVSLRIRPLLERLGSKRW